MSSSRDPTECTGTDRCERWGGLLVAAGAVSIVVAIVLYLTSGAVAPADATAAEIAEGLASAADQVALMAYLSIPANLALLVGAVLLATRSAETATALARRVAWVLVTVASLLVVQFDLLLPHALIPLADGFEQAPLVFEAAYTASNYIHSVGLWFTFAAFLGIFLLEARASAGHVPRPVAYTAVAAWTLGLVVATGLILEHPLVAIAPAILVGWLLVAFLGLRTALAGEARDPPAEASPG